MHTVASETLVHVTMYTRKARGAAQLQVHAKGQADRTPQTEYIPMPVPKESVLGVIIMSGVRTPQTLTPQNPQIPEKTDWELQRAFHPTQISLSLALPFPFGPGLDSFPNEPVPERLELLPNSYCLLLPGRFPFALDFACCSWHSSLQNHLVLPTGAFSSCTQGRWNHSRGHASLSHATIWPYDTSLQ